MTLLSQTQLEANFSCSRSPRMLTTHKHTHSEGSLGHRLLLPFGTACNALRVLVAKDALSIREDHPGIGGRSER